MKKSDVDTIVQGLAPALLAFVSQKLAPVSGRLEGINIHIQGDEARRSATAKQIAEMVAAQIRSAAPAEPEPDEDKTAAFIAALKKYAEA